MHVSWQMGPRPGHLLAPKPPRGVRGRREGERSGSLGCGFPPFFSPVSPAHLEDTALLSSGATLVGGPGRRPRRGWSPGPHAPFTRAPRPPGLTCRGTGASAWTWGQALCRGGAAAPWPRQQGRSLLVPRQPPWALVSSRVLCRWLALLSNRRDSSVTHMPPSTHSLGARLATSVHPGPRAKLPLRAEPGASGRLGSLGL